MVPKNVYTAQTDDNTFIESVQVLSKDSSNGCDYKSPPEEVEDNGVISCPPRLIPTRIRNANMIPIRYFVQKSPNETYEFSRMKVLWEPVIVMQKGTPARPLFADQVLSHHCGHCRQPMQVDDNENVEREFYDFRNVSMAPSNPFSYGQLNHITQSSFFQNSWQTSDSASGGSFYSSESITIPTPTGFDMQPLQFTEQVGEPKFNDTYFFLSENEEWGSEASEIGNISSDTDSEEGVLMDITETPSCTTQNIYLSTEPQMSSSASLYNSMSPFMVDHGIQEQEDVTMNITEVELRPDLLKPFFISGDCLIPPNVVGVRS